MGSFYHSGGVTANVSSVHYLFRPFEENYSPAQLEPSRILEMVLSENVLVWQEDPGTRVVRGVREIALQKRALIPHSGCMPHERRCLSGCEKAPGTANSL